MELEEPTIIRVLKCKIGGIDRRFRLFHTSDEISDPNTDSSELALRIDQENTHRLYIEYNSRQSAPQSSAQSFIDYEHSFLIWRKNVYLVADRYRGSWNGYGNEFWGVLLDHVWLKDQIPQLYEKVCGLDD